MKIHHAPWSRRFKTMWFKGSFAYEFQFGPLVFQWFYDPWERAKFGSHFHVWKDPYWNRQGLKAVLDQLKSS